MVVFKLLGFSRCFSHNDDKTCKGKNQRKSKKSCLRELRVDLCFITRFILFKIHVILSPQLRIYFLAEIAFATFFESCQLISSSKLLSQSQTFSNGKKKNHQQRIIANNFNVKLSLITLFPTEKLSISCFFYCYEKLYYRI